MNFIKKIWKHCLIIILWTFLAIFIALIDYNKNLSASVLSIAEQDFFESKNWDAWYKKANQNFELFLSEKVRKNEKIEVSILYSPYNFEINTSNISSNSQIDKINTTDWNIILQIEWYENANFSEWILQIPYSWDSKNINLEYVKYKNEIYSIWNLDDIENTITH